VSVNPCFVLPNEHHTSACRSEAAQVRSTPAMLDSLTSPWVLVTLFGIHLVVFSVLTIRKRTLQYLPAILAFALLVTLYSLKAIQTGNAALYLGFRVGAGGALATSLLLWFRKKRGQGPRKNGNTSLR